MKITKLTRWKKEICKKHDIMINAPVIRLLSKSSLHIYHLFYLPFMLIDMLVESFQSFLLQCHICKKKMLKKGSNGNAQSIQKITPTNYGHQKNIIKFVQFLLLLGNLQIIIPTQEHLLAMNHQAKLKMSQLKGGHQNTDMKTPQKYLSYL